ncbi:LEM domain-containing inner nuclear membrane protein MAN1 [Haematobia irritans]|uniref:LEM domain-containing inner nuclear membrane protein MAN1 n=1 Tax=Haematobia irritans TaxID=7368 RepID=UPI003F50651B
MNDSYFDNLSDVELRQELKKHGIPAVPIVETTRKLLIKKLKHHVLNGGSGGQKSSPKASRRSLQTTSTVSTHPTTRRNPSPGRRRTVNTFAHTNNNNSSILGNNTLYPNEVSSTDYRSDSGMERKQIYLSNEGVSQLYKDYGNSSSPLSDRNKNLKTSPKIYVPPPIVANDVQHRRPTMATNTRRMTESPRMREMDRMSAMQHQSNAGESSGVVSRLLKLRDISLRGSLPNTTSSLPPTAYSTRNHLYSTDSDSDSGSPTRYSSIMRRNYNQRSIPQVIWSKFNLKEKWKQSSVPYILISCLGLFFVLLAILYMTKPPDMPSTMLEKSTSFTLCVEPGWKEPTSSFVKPYIDCINNEALAPSLALCKELIQLLQTNTEVHYCQDREQSAEVTVSDFMKHLYKKHMSEGKTYDGHKILKSFHAALYLIENNPQWKIQILNKPEGQELVDIYKQDVRFTLLKPYLPLKCILYNKLQRFLFIIGTLFIIALVLLVSYTAWSWWNRRKMMKIKAVEGFCRDVIKELIQRSSMKNDSGEVIINHLRDKLLPINKRKALLWAWNEAIQKLEASDSRIQFAMIMQNGEEFRTMKWCGESVMSSSPPSSPSLSNTSFSNQEKYDGHRPQKKHWQSPAFDNVNRILDPPTNCLKIRHMFDTAEANHPDLRQSVIESILEKVGPQCQIYDIQLDRQNCCVYIRCATEKDAGIIHNEINGWWFDNRLVSIKFLRLPRFLARFPNSTGTTMLTIKNAK